MYFLVWIQWVIRPNKGTCYTDMAVNDQITIYRRGLKPSIRNEVWSKAPETLEDAIKAALDYEITHRHDPLHHSHRRSTFLRSDKHTDKLRTTHSPTRKYHPSAEPSKETTTKPEVDWERYKREGRCVRCHELGHIGIHCPKFPGPAPVRNLKAKSR